MMDVPVSSLRVRRNEQVLTISDGSNRFRVDFSSNTKYLGLFGGLLGMAIAQAVTPTGIEVWMRALRDYGAEASGTGTSRFFLILAVVLVAGISVLRLLVPSGN